MSVEAVVEQRGGRNGWGCGGYPDLGVGGASPISSSKALIKRQGPGISPGYFLWKIEETKHQKKILTWFISCLLVVFSWQPEILVTSLQFLKLIEVPDLPLPPKGKKCEILNLELGKGVRIG